MLKKGIALLLALLLPLASAGAEALPQDVLDDLQTDALYSKGYTVEDFFYPYPPYCMVLLRSPWNDLELCMYEQWYEGWEREWNNQLFKTEGEACFANTSANSFTLLSDEYELRFGASTGDWYVCQMADLQSGMSVSVDGSSGRSPFHFTNDFLSLIDFSGWPTDAEIFQTAHMYYLNPEALLERYGNVPSYSIEGCWQSAYADLGQDVTFPVYSGPGEQYLRGANGKASVSCAEPFSVLGKTGDWLMVLYAISDAQNRVGYVSIAQHWQFEEIAACVQDISFENKMDIHTNREGVPLYDDPIHASKPLATLGYDVEVRLLAQDARWCYVETAYDGEIMRGFILTEELSNG